MHLAFGEALMEGFDYYLWLNDDTVLFANAPMKLLNLSIQLDDKAIVVAPTQDPNSGQVTYGGVRRLDRWRRLKFTSVVPRNVPFPMETMNGNCVLIPQAVSKFVGNLDSAFRHGLGDFDYGLRAHILGIEICIALGFYGHCSRNLVNSQLSLNVRWMQLFSPLGLPPKQWAIFSQRYGGHFWLIFCASPYRIKLFWKRQR